MVHGAKLTFSKEWAVKFAMLSLKNKNRNGFAKKRITEFDNTLGPKDCQCESICEGKEFRFVIPLNY